jgi:TRAP transporter TAXI family solute receptor
LRRIEAGLVKHGKRFHNATLGACRGSLCLYHASGGFKAKLDKLRSIGAIYPNYIQIVATAESGIKTLADLKGKSLSVGAPKSGTELNSRAILAAAGPQLQGPRQAGRGIEAAGMNAGNLKPELSTPGTLASVGRESK